MAKTPSPKVIATKWILNRLDHTKDLNDLLDVTPEDLTGLADSRVNEAKVEKVKEQIEKITLKFRERLEKTVERFETPSTGTGKKSSGKGPTKPAQSKAKEEKKPDKKKPGTRSMSSMFEIDD